MQFWFSHWDRRLERWPNMEARLAGWRRVTQRVRFVLWWTVQCPCHFHWRTVPLVLLVWSCSAASFWKIQLRLLMFQYWMYKYINTVMSFVNQGRHGSKLYLDSSHLYGFSMSIAKQMTKSCWSNRPKLLLPSYIGQPLRYVHMFETEKKARFMSHEQNRSSITAGLLDVLSSVTFKEAFLF